LEILSIRLEIVERMIIFLTKGFVEKGVLYEEQIDAAFWKATGQNL
jgi:hypothetical protein